MAPRDHSNRPLLEASSPFSSLMGLLGVWVPTTPNRRDTFVLRAQFHSRFTPGYSPPQRHCLALAHRVSSCRVSPLGGVGHNDPSVPTGERGVCVYLL